MKILFLSRAYPPIIGGIENQNYELSTWLPRSAEVKTIANKKGRLFLPIFIPYVTIRALWLFRKYDVVLLGDGVLGITGWILKLFYKKPVVSIIHGLDITFHNPIYQKIWIGIFIKRLDKLIAVGNETIKSGVLRGIPAEKFVFIPNGVDTNKLFSTAHSRKDLERISGLDLKNKKVLLTLGRLAKRKGVAWFVENVVPQLPKNVLYLIVGQGKDEENIKAAISKNKLHEKVKFFGEITENEKKVLLNTVDLFIQPNIKIAGDMEGFGIVVLEAASCERAVLASAIEGLTDAIKDGKNGFLTEPMNAEKYAKKISAILSDGNFRNEFGKKARKFVSENYRWEKISKRYVEELNKLLTNA